jgi:sugar (pentulose or hexulose) kinase
MARSEITAVLDIGKSRARVCAASASGEIVDLRERACASLSGPPYPMLDADGLFEWACDALAQITREHPIAALVPVAHGATAALLGRDGLELPVLDYEFDGLPPLELAPGAFSETGSPPLPAGLNLARQLAWQERAFPESFARVESILPWPQYWAWRFGGRRASEVTSLGCHTHLWNPRARCFSQLAVERRWSARFAPLAEAWECVGRLDPAVARRTGLDPACRIHAGIHDSNASYLEHLASRDGAPFTVVSTGTWVVCMARGAPLERLRAELDMLANVDARGDPVPSMRFHGGREFAALAGGEGLELSASSEDVQRTVAAGTLALPSFSDQGGPFARRRGEVRPALPSAARDRAALASLYGALLIDLCLDQLRAEGDVVVEGRLARDAALLGTLAALRGAQECFASHDPTGAVRGAARLARWGQPRPAVELERIAPASIAGLERHRARWRAALA